MKKFKHLISCLMALCILNPLTPYVKAGDTNYINSYVNKQVDKISYNSENDQYITPILVFDKAAYYPGETLNMSLKLSGVQQGDKTNSVSFEVEYDDAFQLATGDENSDIKNGYIQFTSKADTAVENNKRRIQLMYVDMSKDTNLVNDEVVFSVSFNVKKDIAVGKRTFTLMPVNMLDSNFKVYNVNNGKSSNATIEIVKTKNLKVVSAIPQNNESDVAIDSAVIIQFSETVQKGTDFSNIALLDTANKKVSTTVSIAGDKLTIKPKSNLISNKGYTVIIPANALINSSGIGMEGDYSFSFITSPKLLSLKTIPDSIALERNSSYKLKVNAYFDGNKEIDVTEKCQYSSSKTSVAEISSDGTVTAISPGTAKISCKYGGKTANVNVTVTPILVDFKASMDKVQVEMKKSAAVKVTAYYDNDTKKDVTSLAIWESGNINVASVSKGMIKGVSEGETVVTVSYGSKKIVIPVKVIPKLLNITAAPSKPTLQRGDSCKISVTALFDGNKTVDVTKECLYASSKTSVASIASDGTLTAVNPGTATVSIKYGGKTVNISVTVTPVLTDLQVTVGEIEVEKNKSVSVKVTAYYDNNTKKDVTSTAEWISGNSNIASVSKGVIKGINEGQTIITVSFAGKKIYIPVKVTPKLLSIKPNSTSVTIGIGSSYTLNIFALFEGGKEIEVTDKCTYSLSSKKYISLENGVVTAVAKGSTTITIKYMGKSTSIKIIVQ